MTPTIGHAETDITYRLAPNCLTPSTSTPGHARIMIDMPLDAKVLSALERSPHLAGRTLRFETKQGQVTLRGVVRSYYQKQMAQEALRRVDGIQQIHNELEVAGASVMSF